MSEVAAARPVAMRSDDDHAYSEQMAAAGWPDPFADDAAIEAEIEARDAFWRSPEGVALQLAEARADHERWGPIRD